MREITRIFFRVISTWLTQCQHSTLQNVTKGQRLERKSGAFERPMGMDIPRRMVVRVWVAQAVKVFHSSHACSRLHAAGHFGTLHRSANSWRFARGVKSHDRQHRKLATGIRSAWASSLITTFRLPARRGGDGVLPRVRTGSDAFQQRVLRDTGKAVSAAPANTGTTSMPSRERHALKQRTADRRSNHAPHQFFSNT
ncbi:MAG: hypothetical protein ACTHJP_03660 [Rhodanobacteraceae bacterium]